MTTMSVPRPRARLRGSSFPGWAPESVIAVVDEELEANSAGASGRVRRELPSSTRNDQNRATSCGVGVGHVQSLGGVVVLHDHYDLSGPFRLIKPARTMNWYSKVFFPDARRFEEALGALTAGGAILPRA